VWEAAVVDVGVLMSASRLGASQHYTASKEAILGLMRCRIALCIDTEGKIEHQYRGMLGGTSFGGIWARQMATGGLLVRVKRRHLSSKAIEMLSKARFVRTDEDYVNYVRTVAACNNAVLITNDPDYSKRVRAILRSEGIDVLTAREAAALLV
jgi:hypothetical protein